MHGDGLPMIGKVTLVGLAEEYVPDIGSVGSDHAS
jgi:hypothetical protein